MFAGAASQNSMMKALLATRPGPDVLLPKGSMYRKMVYTWALEGFSYSGFRAHVYTTWVHGPLGLGRRHKWKEGQQIIGFL